MYEVSKNNIHIYNSCFIPKREFRGVLDGIADYIARNTIDCVVFKERTTYNLICEWATHNLCYDLGIARDRTHDVDLNAPMEWYKKAAYAIAGTIAYIFIK